jgi:hypothetical protein
MMKEFPNFESSPKKQFDFAVVGPRFYGMAEAKTLVIDMCRVAQIEPPPEKQLEKLATDLVLFNIESRAF